MAASRPGQEGAPPGFPFCHHTLLALVASQCHPFGPAGCSDGAAGENHSTAAGSRERELAEERVKLEYTEEEILEMERKEEQAEAVSER